MGDLNTVIQRGLKSLNGGDVSEAVRGAFVRIGPLAGDPAYGWINLRLDWDDAALRALKPDFNGLETVYAEVPGFGRRTLRYLRDENGIDVFETSISYRVGQDDPVRYNDVAFGVSTNVGEFPDIAVGSRRPY
jgi:hypothetical protein